MSKKPFLSKLLFTLIMAMFSLAFILPLLWMISSSLKTEFEVMSFHMKWIPDNLQWKNYINVVTRKSYPIVRVYYNSLAVASGTILGALLICTTSGYAFAKLKFRGKNILFLLYLSTLMIPMQVTLIPRFYLIRAMGLYNNLLALVLPACFSAIGIFMMTQTFKTIPKEYIESGKIDGAGHFVIFYKLHLPLIIPSLIALSILVFVISWSEFLNPLIFINTSAKYTLPLFLDVLMNAATGMGYQYHYSMAAGVVGTVPLVLVFIFLQRYFIESIVVTGIKG